MQWRGGVSHLVFLKKVSESVSELSLPPRIIRDRYEDPLSLIWLQCLASIGWHLERSSEVFASWDGQKMLTIGVSEDLDPDDHLGQLILHELCHALLEGERGRGLPDWGLANTDGQHLVNELACHRLQAHLADQYHLRKLFAVTTDWRPYFDHIPKQALKKQSESQIREWADRFGLSPSVARSMDLTAIKRVEMICKAADENQNILSHQDQLILSSVHQALSLSRELADLVAKLSLKNTLWS